MKKIALTAFILLTSAFAAAAAPRTAAIDAVLACRGVVDKTAQLDCFMVASRTLDAETMAAAPPPKPRPFGLPRAPAPKAAKVQEPRSITLKLTGLFDPGDGRVAFNFDDGSTWRELEPEMIGGALALGQKVIIEKALFGSYMLDIPGRSSVRVKRDRDR